VFARCFIEHTSLGSPDASCSGIGLINGQLTEDAGMPVVTAFAFFLQEACNRVLDSIEELEILKVKEDAEHDTRSDGEDDSNIEHCEETFLQKVCILSEMLKIAACLDYTDEVGRRKMFLVVRECFTELFDIFICLNTVGSMMGVEHLPESLVDSCLEVLMLTTNDREMVKITVEVMTELRDSLFNHEELDSDTDELAEVSPVILLIIHAFHCLKDPRGQYHTYSYVHWQQAQGRYTALPEADSPGKTSRRRNRHEVSGLVYCYAKTREQCKFI
jgi:hypothetical protein